VFKSSVNGTHVHLNYCVIAHTSFTNVAAESMRPAGCRLAPMHGNK